MVGELHPRILDTRTGEAFHIDPDAARIGHLRHRVHAWCTALRPYLVDANHNTRLVMVTLTYAQVGHWRPNHIRDFMNKMRKELGSNLLAYVWVAELQQRGAVHYHLLLLVRRGTSIPYPDARFWVWGASRIETARNRFYIMKYASKAAFKTGDDWVRFPRGLRLFAVWLSDEVVADLERFHFRLSALPRWLVDLVTEIGMIVLVKRAKGGGWFITGDTGPPEHIKSPYRLLSLYD